MLRDKLGPGGRYRTRLLAPPDIAAVQGLFERGADYFVTATGLAPAPDEATRAFVAGPPTKSVDDKRVIGVFDGDTLVGILDALSDFPEPGDWTMGILLLDPEHRGSGLGSLILKEYETWAAGEGAKRYHTAVVGHHESGIRFLEQSGYRILRTLENYDAGGQTTPVVFLTKAS